MKSKEIVQRTIEFKKPSRLPFFQNPFPDIPSDACDLREMDRAKAGWFFTEGRMDDWGCGWERTDIKNMGQVVEHPLEDFSNLSMYVPPNPCDIYYFERIEPLLHQAGERYTVVTSHFNLIERLQMLRGFVPTMEGFYLHPNETDQLLDMILEFKLKQLEELHRRFGNDIHGIFLTDDWGTQQGLFIKQDQFEQFFAQRYQVLFDAIHQLGWHVIFHSCGKVNKLISRLTELGADVLNLQQPQTYGISAIGEQFRGKVCFLTTADIQQTLVKGTEEDVRAEVRELVTQWSTPQGGLIVFNYGDPESLGIRPGITEIMFEEFKNMMYFHSNPEGHSEEKR